MPFADFHRGDFSRQGVETKFLNISAQLSCYTFASVRAGENRVKILHSLGRYVAKVGAEVSDKNHNQYYGFKGDRTRRGEPPPYSVPI